jgi:hypothetical protein
MRSTIFPQLSTPIISKHPDIKAGLGYLLIVQLYLVSVYFDLEPFLCQEVLTSIITKSKFLQVSQFHNL